MGWGEGCPLSHGPCDARGRCRISPPRFLAECRKKRLNQGSFVSAVCLVVCFLWFVLCLCIFVIYIEFFPYCLFVSNSQVIDCEDRLQNDLYCVGWGVKLYSIQSKSPFPLWAWIFWNFQVKNTKFYAFLLQKQSEVSEIFACSQKLGWRLNHPPNARGGVENLAPGAQLPNCPVNTLPNVHV